MRVVSGGCYGTGDDHFIGNIRYKIYHWEKITKISIKHNTTHPLRSLKHSIIPYTLQEVPLQEVTHILLLSIPLSSKVGWFMTWKEITRISIERSLEAFEMFNNSQHIARPPLHHVTHILLLLSIPLLPKIGWFMYWEKMTRISIEHTTHPFRRLKCLIITNTFNNCKTPFARNNM